MPLSQNRLARVRALFFDLDGTLLQVEMQRFIPAYLDGLATHLGPRVEPAVFRALARGGIMSLLDRGDRDGCNREAFLRHLERHGGIEAAEFDRALRACCAEDLETLRPMVKPLPQIRDLLDAAFASGREVVIATNPVFPREVIEARLRWGRMADYPFALVSDWENSTICKPAGGYFVDLLDHLRLQPEEALMIGNDTGHDLAAGHAGIATLLVETWLIERGGSMPAPAWQGDHDDLLQFLRNLPA